MMNVAVHKDYYIHLLKSCCVNESGNSIDFYAVVVSEKTSLHLMSFTTPVLQTKHWFVTRIVATVINDESALLSVKMSKPEPRNHN